jgi:hypothetical protein
MLTHLGRTLAVSLVPMLMLGAQELRRTAAPIASAACYDPGRQRVVVTDWGGYSREWDGAVWRNAPDLGSRGRPFLDGQGRLMQVVAPVDALDLPLQLLLRDGARYVDITPLTGPPARYGAALQWFPPRNGLVLFGGALTTTGQLQNETWLLDPDTGWSQLATPTAPSPRFYSSLCYDSVRQRLVLFGGDNNTLFGTLLGDTWELSIQGWTPVATAVSPSPRYGAAIAFDPLRQRTILNGGYAGGTPTDQLFEYDGQNWQQMPPSPPAVVATTHHATLVHDAARAETLLLGGFDAAGASGLVFAWNGATWSPRPGFPPMPLPPSVEPAIGATGTGGLLRFGGLVQHQGFATGDTWGFDGNTWSLLATTGPPPRANGVLWRQVGQDFLFGGTGPYTHNLLGDQWRWNGTVWSAVVPTTSPPPLWGAAIAVDAAANRAVLFGGCNASFASYAALSRETWLFDGVTWQLMPQTVGMRGRYRHAMAYDPQRSRVVLFGGFAQGAQFGSTGESHDTWEWNGSLWTRIPTTQVPPSRSTLAFDAPSGRVWATQRSSGPPELWSYDGVDWTPRAVIGTAGSPIEVWLNQPHALTMASGHFGVVYHGGVAELLPTPARVTDYGASCGLGAPLLAAAAQPRVPSPTFQLDVAGLAAHAPAAIAGANGSATVPLLGCTLLVAPNVATVFLSAGSSGLATYPLPVPNAPSLVGASVFFQAAALAPQNPNGFALSRGLRVDLGQ